jgi:hypothetical protein
MSHESPPNLPSLAHPLIVHPAQGLENEEDHLPQRQPPFPHIDLNWDGFTISHLHWVGIKIIKAGLSDVEDLQRVQLVLLHESSHKDLALTPFSRFKKYKIFGLHGKILETFTEAKVRIRVPVKPNVSGNEVQKKLAWIKYLHEVSAPVEEAYAVRSSLLEALKLGIIKNDNVRQQIITAYKEAYEKDIPLFSLTYRALDLVARKFGENAATGMILCVFETLNPILAFRDIITEWKLPDELTAFLAKLSVKQAQDFFSNIINELDTDASPLYRRACVLEFEEEILKSVGEEFRKKFSPDDFDDFVKSDSYKLLYSSPTSFVLTGYDDFIHPSVSLLKLDELKAAGVIKDRFDLGDMPIVLEAIMQQLTTGLGLLCPFWVEHPALPPTCCIINRELLEKVWECTSPTRSCKRWERMGCLAEGACATC